MATDEDDELGLSDRLSDHWRRGARGDFCALFLAEAEPRLIRGLMAGLNIQHADAEECVSLALEAMLRQPDGNEIDNPYAYARRAAHNNGTTLHRRRRRELVRSVEALSPAAGPDAADAIPRGGPFAGATWAVIAVEEALGGDIEAEEHWAEAVVETAIERLSAGQARVIRHLVGADFDLGRQDFDVRSKQAAGTLGMTDAAFRKAKQRAYEALAQAIPAIVAELGIEPPTRVVSAFAETRGRFLADDDLDGGG